MSGSKVLAAIVAAAALAGAGTDRAAAAGPVYGEVQDATDLDRIFGAIRADIARAQTRAELTRLYRRAGYLVTLTYSRPWRVKFGEALPRLREEARRDFRGAVQEINRRAAEIGTEPDYDDRRGER